MLKQSLFAALLLLVGLSGACNRVGAEAPPGAQPTRHGRQPNQLRPVTDKAGIISEPQEAALAGKLAALERRTGVRMVIVTIPSLGGKEIAAYTRDLANSADVDGRRLEEGVMILVAPSDRQARIAVSRALEKRLPDELCASVMKLIMTPRFARGDMYGGIDAATDALIRHLG